ncbi:MFS transporter [Mumia sp. ZJ430]|uniref:MFS transporter n=1 Tax=Mumia sp. ZJ430 TaxID=2708083 RepID=UPI001420E035|nr:MFS transporter [Mumia sp. ZJ430]
MRRKPHRARSTFGWLWAGQSASVLGDQVTLIALPLVAVAHAGGSTSDIAVVATLLKLPFLVLGLPAGVWVTRWGLGRSMLGADLVRLLVLGFIAALILLRGEFSIVVLMTAAALIGSATVFFQIAYQSIVPEVVPDQAGWHPANLRLTLSESWGMLAGPALGGLLISVWSLGVALSLDALTFALSAATLVVVTLSLPPPARRVETAPLFTSIRVGFRYVLDRPVLRGIMVVGAVFNIGVAMFETMLVLYGVKTLSLDVAQVGVAVAAGGLGFPLGGLASGRLNRRFGKGRVMALAGIPSVAGIAVLGLATQPVALVLLATGMLVFGLGQGAFAVNAVTLRHEHAEPHMRAQATSVHRFASWGALPVGTLLAGLVAGVLGLRAVMLVGAAISALCLVPLWSPEIRRAP